MVLLCYPLDMVYFVQDMRKHFIKIGYSNQMSARLQTLRSEFGLVRLLATTEGMAERERELHKRFHADRVKGEWFDMSDDLCCFVSKLNPKLQLSSNSGTLWKAGCRLSRTNKPK